MKDDCSRVFSSTVPCMTNNPSESRLIRFFASYTPSYKNYINMFEIELFRLHRRKKINASVTTTVFLSVISSFALGFAIQYN